MRVLRQVKLKRTRFCPNDRPLHNVLQLADVTRPRIALKSLDVPLLERPSRHTQPPAGLPEEVSGQQPHIVRPLAQRSGFYGEYAEAIKKIFAKSSCFDYPNQHRIKIWGTAEFIEDDPELLDRVADRDYNARPRRVLVFHLKAWDVNCTQHIQQRYTVEEMQPMVEELRHRIAELEAKNAALEARPAVEEVGAGV